MTGQPFDFEVKDEGPYGGRGKILASNPPFWSYSVRGDWGNQRVVLACRDEGRFGFEEIRGWRPAKERPGVMVSVWENTPTRAFMGETTSRVVQRAPNLLQEWKSAAMTMASLPRVLWQREGEATVEGTRRKRRELRVRCGYGDRFIQEFIKWQRGYWDPAKRAWSLMAKPEMLDMIETVLSMWTLAKRRPAPVMDEREMEVKWPFLKVHQIDAIRFLLQRWGAGPHGALVADDMGLGKTCSSMAAGLAALDQGLASRILVVGPVAVLDQWIGEWTSGDRFGLDPQEAFKYCAPTVEKLKCADEDELVSVLGEKRLIVTNYEFLRDPSRLRPLMGAAMNAYAVFDEATKCKNPDSDNFFSAMFLSMLANFSVGLSGTPVVNNIGEMWTIFRLLDPAIYPSKEFYGRHVEMKEEVIWRRDASGKPQKKTIRVPHYKEIDLFNQLMKPHFIRRYKTQVPGFAQKTEEWMVLPVEGTVEDETAKTIEQTYTAWNRSRLTVEDMLLEESHKTWQLDMFGYMQSAVDDPYIIFQSPAATGDDGRPPEDPRVIHEIVRNLDEEKLRNYVPVKARRLAELLEGSPGEMKAVVFTNYIRTVNRLLEHLGARMDRPLFVITGQKTPRQKARTLAEFKASEGGVLLCTDALSYGTNLQFADLLVHYGLPWEPATFKQRTGRIHRMGTKVAKRIVFLVTDHDVENHRRALIENKTWISVKALQR